MIGREFLYDQISTAIGQNCSCMAAGPPRLGPHPGCSELRTIGEELLQTFEQLLDEDDQ